MIPPSDAHYGDDFSAWTEEQAAPLRQLPAGGNRLDLAHIAEEIEDLGRSDLRAAQSLCEPIIEPLLKPNSPGSTSRRNIGATRSSNGGSSSKRF
jgi:hypothetical protein